MDKVFEFKEGLDAFQGVCKKLGIEYKIQIRDGSVKGTITSKKWVVNND